jgi:hypothetical protein|tara:strand:+ start:19879 stop:20544 length:666 start_codon:yes stop_codon:yes gene_type:complete
MSHDKLNVSKNTLQSTETSTTIQKNPIKEFKTPRATYNIPDNITNSPSSAPPTTSMPKPINMKPHAGLNEERINKSNLPPEIKKLMIDNPIQDPASAGGATLNDDFINKVSEKMKSDEFSVGAMRSASNNSVSPPPPPQRGNYIPPKQKVEDSPIPVISENFNTGLDYQSLKEVIKECVQEVITENGINIEESNINENLQLRVGNKIFLGNIKKVKTVKKK